MKNNVIISAASYRRQLGSNMAIQYIYIYIQNHGDALIFRSTAYTNTMALHPPLQNLFITPFFAEMSAFF